VSEIEFPLIPRAYNRHSMNAQERVESYMERACTVLASLDELDPDDRAAQLARSLASAYAEGHQDGRTYGVEPWPPADPDGDR
jgi:hypothetical protein